MKSMLTSVCFFIATISASAQFGENFKLPETWATDFNIVLRYHGSMGGGATNIKFTYDSCIYNSSSNKTGKEKKRTYILKDADRIAILKKLQELKVDKIKTESGVSAVNDGWSQSICFNFHCIEGGTSVEMTEKNKNLFLDAYRFLEEFAMKKTK